MVLLAELLNFTLVPASQVANEFFIFIASALERCLHDLKLAPAFIQGISRALKLLPARLYLKAELSFKVLLNAHSENVRVDRQHHLLGQSLQIRLLSLDKLGHLVKPLLKLRLQGLALGHLVDEAFLVAHALLLDRGEVHLKVGEQLVHVLFLHCGRLECFFDAVESPFKLVLFFNQRLGHAHCRRLS